MDTLITHMGFPRSSQRQGGGRNQEELFIWVDSCILLQLGLLFIMYPLLPGACLAPCSRKGFFFSSLNHITEVLLSTCLLLP